MQKVHTAASDSQPGSWRQPCSWRPRDQMHVGPHTHLPEGGKGLQVALERRLQPRKRLPQRTLIVRHVLQAAGRALSGSQRLRHWSCACTAICRASSGSPSAGSLRTCFRVRPSSPHSRGLSSSCRLSSRYCATIFLQDQNILLHMAGFHAQAQRISASGGYTQQVRPVFDTVTGGRALRTPALRDRPAPAG